MAAGYRLDGRLFVLELEGSYTMDDLLEACHQAIADPAFPEDALALMDVRTSTSLKDRSAADLRYMAQQLAQLSANFGARLAIATGNQLYYGMMRMAEVFSETSGMSVRAFITFEEAKAWLELPEEEPPR